MTSSSGVSLLLAIGLAFSLVGPRPAFHLDDSTYAGWTSHAPSHTPRTEGVGIVYDGKLYVLAGFARDVIATHLSEVYDPDTDSWSLLTPIPRAVSHADAELVDGRIWIVGGFEGDHPGRAVNIVQIYDIATNTWISGPPLPSARASGTLALLGRKLHYVGGLLPDRSTDVGDHYVLDVDLWEGGWTPAAALPKPRNHLSSAVFEGRLYAIGGQFGHDRGRTISPLVHVYESSTDTWSPRAKLPHARSHAEASTFVYNSRIIVAGGVGPGPLRTASVDLISAYDPSTDTWMQIETLPEKLLGLEAGIIEGRLYAANGSIGLSGNAQARTWSLPVEPEAQDILGFWPSKIEIELAKGQSKLLDVFLWTHNETAEYTIDSFGLPTWISSVAPESGSAVPTGTMLNVVLDASHLEADTYQTRVTATASGYPVATFTVTLNVAHDSTSDPGRPYVFSLASSSPNPFKGRTLIRYSLAHTTQTTLCVYNLLGELVAVLVNETKPAGSYEVDFVAGDLASGIYMYVLRAGDFHQVRSMVLAK